MIYGIQTASLLKRISAWLLDIIMFLVVVTGCIYGWSFVFDPAVPMKELNGIMEQYEQEYGGKLMTDEEISLLPEEQQAEAKALSTKIDEALGKDERALVLLEMTATKLFALISLSVLCAYTLLEFVVPLLLKNGQTLGKKCFGLALMRKDGVKVTPFMMFVRTILGKSTVETMIPVYLLVLFALGAGELLKFLGVALVLAQGIIPLWTNNRVSIHDMIACTVVVDMHTQMIFDSPEEKEAYIARIEEMENETSEAE